MDEVTLSDAAKALSVLQEQVDRLNKAINENLLASMKAQTRMRELIIQREKVETTMRMIFAEGGF